MNKVIFVGAINNVRVFAKVAIKNGYLSISGVEGPTQNGNCVGSCGQIIFSFKEYDPRGYRSVWDVKPDGDLPLLDIRKFFDVWDRWHLNDMQAGTPLQMQYLRDHPTIDYTAACKLLQNAGLNPDNGYQYGSAWLKEPLPQEIITFLESLPNSSVTPAWV